jgi:predicted ATP-dependent protease
VTGSVNQQGDIQPIGGVNQKIEGFYDVCRVKEFTGRQGVLIPVENVEDLMLREDVVEAVAAGNFHILPVATVEEGIEALTGVRAGGVVRRSGEDGQPSVRYEPGTVFALVDQRLRQMAETLKDFE